MKKLTITVSGPQGSGKSVVARVIAELLQNAGITLTLEDDGTIYRNHDIEGMAPMASYLAEVIGGAGTELAEISTLTLPR